MSISSSESSSRAADRAQLFEYFQNIASSAVQRAALQANAQADPAADFAMFALQNQIMANLEAADRLLSRSDERLTASELASLGAAFSSVGDYERAEAYMTTLLEVEGSTLLRASGLRSIANLYVQRTPEDVPQALEMYAQAIALLRDDGSAASVGEYITIRRHEAGALLAFGARDRAEAALQDALTHIAERTCVAGRFALSASIYKMAEDNRLSLINPTWVASACPDLTSP